MKSWAVILALSLIACDVPQTPLSNQAVETKSVSIVSLAQTSVSDTNYLRECQAINSSKVKEQILYRNVQPGQTKESELELLLGNPNKKDTLKGVTNWVYNDIGLLIEKGIVTNILVTVHETSGLTLERVIQEYGCPDIVFVVNTCEDCISYSAIDFVYYRVGMEFRFSNYPTNLTEVPSTVKYFPPMDLQEYLESSGWPMEGLFFGKPIDWNEAVNQLPQ